MPSLSEVLVAQFKKSSYSNVKDWKDSTKVPLSTETVSKVLLRSWDPGIATFITMAYHLGLAPLEIAAACKQAGDTVFYKLINPVDISSEDRIVLDLLSRLPASKKAAIITMIKAMGD